MEEERSAQDPGFEAASAPAPEPVRGIASRVRTEFACVSCGYGLRGIAVDALCPECGTPVMRSVQGGAGVTSGSAIASMVLGIVSVIGCVSYGFLSIFCGPLAIWFSVRAQRQLRAGAAGGSTRGMATAGLITGIIGTVLGLGVLGFFVTVIALPLMIP